MCGIIGMAGNLVAADKKRFEELLYADVVRGVHSTGIATVKASNSEVNTFKMAYPSSIFLELPTTKQLLTPFTSQNVVIGHNRHATKGSSSDHAGAHPFQHGHITLVHNGSLTSHWDLTPATETYTVDSEAICRGIELHGIEVIAKKLKGAFALVWVDSNLNTLNFLRNDERPLGFAFDSKGSNMYWASELPMLEWILGRDTFQRSPVDLDETMELEVGEWWSVPLTKTGVDLDNIEVKELELYSPQYGRTVTTKSTVQTTESDLYTFDQETEDSLALATTRLVNNIGGGSLGTRTFISLLDATPKAYDISDRLGFFMTEFKKTNTASIYGAISGVTMEWPHTKCTIHGFKEEDWEVLKKSNGFFSAYVNSITRTSHAAGDYGKTTTIDNVDTFMLGLRKDSVRMAKLQDYVWDVDHAPTTGLAAEGITKFVQGLAVTTLDDDTTVNDGGTAVFTGSKDGVLPNERYTVIGHVTVDSGTFLQFKIGNVQHAAHTKYWQEGLEKDAKFQGFSGMITQEQWKENVHGGCSTCGITPSILSHEDIMWYNTNFYDCGACLHDYANRGYN